MARDILISAAHLIGVGLLLVGGPLMLGLYPPSAILEPRPLGFLGFPLMAGAFAAALWMGKVFVVVGHGTPNPAAPPDRLVIQGLYQYVRNPGYWAAAAFLAGEALWVGSLAVFVYGSAVMLGLHLFVVLFEEPGLRKRFGDAYREYCETVPRWMPRFR